MDILRSEQDPEPEPRGLDQRGLGPLGLNQRGLGSRGLSHHSADPPWRGRSGEVVRGRSAAKRSSTSKADLEPLKRVLYSVVYRDQLLWQDQDPTLATPTVPAAPSSSQPGTAPTGSPAFNRPPLPGRERHERSPHQPPQRRCPTSRCPVPPQALVREGVEVFEQASTAQGLRASVPADPGVNQGLPAPPPPPPTRGRNGPSTRPPQAPSPRERSIRPPDGHTGGGDSRRDRRHDDKERRSNQTRPARERLGSRVLAERGWAQGLPPTSLHQQNHVPAGKHDDNQSPGGRQATDPSPAATRGGLA
ncbi:PREDICTED: splicing factor, proline- and glutamine-rich-like [Ipomoea nil]|uniref:splicing factor, proline- and glutamine-rich-like n=1 Tax=Ipomoea nil TaxID=35883 RepID=UPI000901A1BC|nr:PREDICTED: splicing factor, proline- and glutamine-rich-like [Ipomoea nil]